MVVRLSLARDRNLFLLVVICCFEVLLCQSLDGVGPWQPWSRCSASCGEGEQTRRRDCLISSLQSERRIQTMHSNVFGCRGNKSMITRRPCKLVPCSYFKTELDPSSIPTFSYSLTDPAGILHQFRDEDKSVAAVAAYGYDSTSKTTDDDGCSVFNQSLACRNSTSDHVRLRREIRLAMGEMIYSNWTPWTKCSCTTSIHTRYRFCIVGKRQCIRAKGLFPTEETEPCQCGNTRGSRKGMKNHLRSRMYQPERTDPYTQWSNWDRCPCERDAFRSRSRMCRPGHEMACFERKQETGIGIVNLNRCRPPPGCQGVGPMSDRLEQQERLPVQDRGSQVETELNWSPWVEVQTCSKTCDTGTTMRRRECTDEGGRVQVGCPGEEMDTSECNTNPCPVEVRLNWSPWVEVQTCSKTCDTGTTMRRRECTDQGGMIQVGCYGSDMDTPQCNTNPCPVEVLLNWSPWVEVQTCSKSCETGTTMRRRECTDEGGRIQVGCIGTDMDEPECNTNPCPVESAVETGLNWSPWVGIPWCSKTCGVGNTLRTRKCLDGRGLQQVGCPGNEMDRPACNPGPCGVNGVRRPRPFMLG